MNILHIDSSIQGAQSASRAITAAIVETLRAKRPDARVTYRDVAADPLPHIALATLGDAAGNLALQEFLAADTVVIGVPMINFTIPSQLKAWLDHLVVPGQTFHYTAEGPQGLAGGKRLIIAPASGGRYRDGDPAASLEHAQSYLRALFGFLGVTDIEVVAADGLKIDPDKRDDVLSAAIERARTIGVPAALAA